MKVYKDNEHSITLSPFSWQGRRYLSVCVGSYVVFDPRSGESRIRNEQDFWKETPDLFAALGQTPVLDMGLPKPGAEVLVAGFCRTPDAKVLPAQEVAFRVGSTARRIAVFGDRQRLPGGGFSDPLPFAAMPLVWEKAFGGPDFPANPAGKGLAKDDNVSEQVPNLEDPDNFILSGNDRPRPACPFPVDAANPERRALSGTYDNLWLETRWPAYPDDLNPEYFYSAQPEQRLKADPGAPDDPPFFRGDEEIEIIGMSHKHPHIRSRLPEMRIRAFVTTAEHFTPFAPASGTRPGGEQQPLPYAKDLDQPGIFREVTLRADTVWLLPDLMGVFVLRRGLLPVEDDEMDDILRVYVVTEKASEAPKSLEYYLEEQKKRIRPSVEIDVAPFIKARAETAKMIKTARDLPKFFEKIKKDFLGQNPVMPLSLGDMSHSARKTLAGARATLDTLERQMLAQREQFSHLVSFDLSIFPRMRANLDEQEKNLESMLRRADAAMRQADEKLKSSVAGMRRSVAQNPFLQKHMGDNLHEPLDRLDALDALSPEKMLCRPQPLNPWHDRGFSLLIDARRALRRDDGLLARLAALGFAEKTLEDAWIGYAAEALADKPENWGLPPGPAFILPAGLYVPRFAGRELVALRVYPLPDPEAPDADLIRGLGTDAPALFLVPGSDAKPLSLPPSYPDGIFCVAPEDLSALFAEQEAGDFCHIAAAPDPAALGAVKGLPPLLPEKDGLPLVVILPPEVAGKKLFAPWAAAYPAARPLFLREGCPHVAALAGQGQRLRPLLLEILPPELARKHDFDTPVPPSDGPPKPFTLNMPLPTKEEIQGRIETLMKDIRAYFPDPQTRLAEELTKAKGRAFDILRRVKAPQEAFDKLEAAFAEAARPKAPAPPISVADAVKNALARLAAMKERAFPLMRPEEVAKLHAAIDQAMGKVSALGEQLGPLDKLRAEGMAKIEAIKKGELPEEIRAAFAAKGMDPDALKKPTREEVEAMPAAGKNLARRNLQGLDLSGLDFTGADLSHAICAGTNFRGCRMDGANFTFTIANGADFTEAGLRGAHFMQTVLQKAVLRGADLTSAYMELTTLGESDAAEAIFDKAEVRLSNFDKADVSGARFWESALSLCAFGEIKGARADFRKVRAFKCLFRKSALAGARFEDATLEECLFQGASCAGLSFAGADLRKLHADVEADFSGADFFGADLRGASMRLSRFVGADFYAARLEDAFFTQCDLSRAWLDGIRATGCRFIKCDFSGADLSGTELRNGALRKCRLTGADLTGTGLYGANLLNMVVGGTSFAGANLKRTALEGKEKELRRESRRDS
jgi:uncharacterized protein YjbI with pentapeptide repeats